MPSTAERRVAAVVAAVGTIAAAVVLALAGVGATATPAGATSAPSSESAIRTIAVNQGSFTSLSACAVTSTKGVACWGPIPVAGYQGIRTITGLSNIVTVTGGRTHYCALDAAGAVRCWGKNDKGQMGNGSTGSSEVTTPVVPTGLGSGVVAIDAGWDSTCAVLSTGAVDCWGDNQNAHLGWSTANAPVTTPTEVPNVSGATAIAHNTRLTCAATSADVTCWGIGILGNGAAATSDPTVRGHVTGLGPLRSIGVGYAHACALRSDGSVWCWGEKLPTGLAANALSPTAITSLSSDVRSLAVGGFMNCATKVDGTAWCWGSTQSGSLLGDGGAATRSTPAQLAVSSVASIDIGDAKQCAEDTSGVAHCWGDGYEVGALGSVSIASPTVVTDAGTAVAQVAMGASHTCWVTTDGAAKCMGDNSYGQLGKGSTSFDLVRGVASPTGLSSGVSLVVAGTTYSCALTTAGGVKCWGSNSSGELGVGDTSSRSTPTDVVGMTSGVTKLVAGGARTCAIKTGALYCWGSQTGTVQVSGFQANTTSPTLITTTYAPSGLGGGYGHDCATKPDNTVQCWGSNANNAFGSGSATPSISATPVTTSGLTATQLALGDGFGCARTSTDVRCWGKNDVGQLGNGTTTTGTTPGIVSGSAATSPSAVGAIRTEACSLGSGGAVRCWGAGTTTPTTKVASGIASLGTGASASHWCAVTTAHELTCWGLNDRGQASQRLGYDSLIDTPAGWTFAVNLPPAINRPPVPASQTTSAPRHVATPITVAATDPDGDTVSYAVSTPPTKGSASCSSGGTCTYTSDLGATGTDSFTFAASDGNGGTAIGTVTVNLTNTPPVATHQSVTAHRGVATPIALSATDANADAVAISAPTSGPSHGSLDCTSGACTYTATSGPDGTDSFTFTADDGNGGTDVGTVDLTLVDDAPVPDPQALTALVNQDTPITLTATDPNHDPVSFAVATAPTKGTLDCTGAACTYRAAAYASGSDWFTFAADDGHGATATGRIDLSLSPTRPVADPQAVHAPRQVPTPITLTGSTPITAALAFTAPLGGPTKGTLDCTGAACTYTSSPGASGTDSFTFQVANGTDQVDTATVTIELTNSAPAGTPATYHVTKGLAKAFTLAGTDPNGDPLTYAVTGAPTKGSLTCDGPTGGSCRYTATDAIGHDTITFAASDDQGGTSAPTTIDLDIALPKVSLGDAQVLEPDAGTSGAFVPLSLAAPLTTDVTVRYYTVNGTATGTTSLTGGDYLINGRPTAPQSIRIPAGQTWTAIGMNILADGTAEPDETFTVAIASITAADGSTIEARDPSGTVTILDSSRTSSDPMVSVSDSAVYEGDVVRTAAGTTRVQFILQLSKPLAAPVTLSYRTIDGTATAGPEGAPGSDYRAITSGTITLPAGASGSRAIDLAIFGDTVTEDDETLQLQLVVPDGAALVQRRTTATATIRNDD